MDSNVLIIGSFNSTNWEIYVSLIEFLETKLFVDLDLVFLVDVEFSDKF